MAGSLRLSPTSASRRILALEFVRRYFVLHGASPSFGEIAAALGVPIQRVSGIVRELVAAGEIVHSVGVRRGLRLPHRIDELSTSEALVILQRRGWTVDRAARQLREPVTNPTLTRRPCVAEME